jgi:N-acyl-D-amino-acid deacylase
MKSISRFAFVAAIFGLLEGADQPTQAANQFRAWQGISITGTPVPRLEGLDRLMAHVLVKYRVPGGALAVARNGRLMLAHGYGMADVEGHQAVQAGSLFRIASVSKTITSATVLKLVERGQLNLDAKAFELLSHLRPPPGATVDARINDITVRHLLQHAGGWDRDRSGDPMFRPFTTRAAQAFGTPEPASSETIIRYVLRQPLDFSPGTSYAYSNLGYAVLGRIIEKVTGERYEDHVRANVLAPMGIRHMRLGRTRAAERAEGEVRYYDSSNGTVRPVFSGEGAVAAPYGSFWLEAMDAHGGWLGSSIDLVRFVTALEGKRPPPFANAQTIRLMVSRPDIPCWANSPFFYGMGWSVKPTRNDADWWHNGALSSSTYALLVRTHHGLSWAALFNSLPQDPAFADELDTGLWSAASVVKDWPTSDLFGQYP